MSGILQLDYYYGIEAEQFSFYRVPRLLIKDERFKKLSSDAKLLYGLIIEQQNERLRQECADVRELMAGLRAIHTFYEKNEGMITGN